MFRATFTYSDGRVEIEDLDTHHALGSAALARLNVSHDWVLTVEEIPTFTLDAEKDGVYYEDHHLTATEVTNAYANADRLGITILAVTEETPVSPDDLDAFGTTRRPRG